MRITGIQPRAHDLEDLPAVRALAGVFLALLAFDSYLWFVEESPGARSAALGFLALPLAVALARALGPLGRRALTGLTLPALGGAAIVGGFGWLWSTTAPTPFHGVEDSARLPACLPDDLLLTLERSPDPVTALLLAALAVPATIPLLAIRLRGWGIGAHLVAGGIGGVFAVAPLAAARDPFDMATSCLLGAAIGLWTGGACYLLVRAPGDDLAGEARPLAWLEDWPRALAVAAVVAGVGFGLFANTNRRPPLLTSPDLEPALEACVEANARYLEKHGRYSPSLGQLAVDRGLIQGVNQGYVIRYATFNQGKGWALAADPIPPLPGLSSFKADPGGVRRATRAQPLQPAGGWRP